ncbi:2Fe-2S iron-sulfur cluster-binding protein [Kitasatospora cheerisanensis]|uniref:2Fe-2S iron-sulfur cluster-binding protein n=1 Tax=Kitasatospora cheerisanensis TaxID=81942 RepID=UPI001AD7ED07|nr:2Fe-2S iron-sulfur cluster binding domain-containing protein [Kitasatospora cheerisanensis]
MTTDQLPTGQAAEAQAAEEQGHRVVLTTSDGARLEVCCPPGTAVLEAAAEAGAALPASCRQGTCGSCHATVTSGGYDLGPHSAQALPPEEREQGGVLLCRTVPRGPLCAELPYPQSRILYGGVPVRAAEVAAVTAVARDTVRLELTLTDSPDCQFDAGQFVELELPGTGVRRAYSLANTGNWDGRMEFFVRVRPGGAFSGPLAERVRPGDPLTVHGPQGAFGLHETGLRPRWLLAGGTGLAPLLAMARQMAEWQDPQPVRLFLGVNTPEEVFGAEELTAVAAELPGFRHQVCVREPDAAWTGPVGTPADLLAEALAGHTGPVPDLYVCGPPPMVDAVRRAAPGCQVFHERFLAS